MHLDLGPLAPIEAAAESWLASILAPERGPDPRAGEALRSAILDPVLHPLFEDSPPESAEISTLIVVPTGVLHRIPFDALPQQHSSAPLGMSVAIERRSSVEELLRKPPAKSSAGGLVALGLGSIGGADEEGGAREARARSSFPALRRGGFAVDPARAFESLPFAEAEAAALVELFAGRAGGAPVHLLVGRDATSAALRARAPGARWLHIASHAWAELQPSVAPLTRERGSSAPQGLDPLQLTGLVLLPASDAPTESRTRAAYLSAEELVRDDFSGCELAVLAAGGTHVGPERAGRPLASLASALHEAGARTVIASLWEVPDRATHDLMLDFYRRVWTQGQPKHRALWEAKMALREAKDELGLPLHTLRDWAGWVLIGEPD